MYFYKEEHLTPEQQKELNRKAAEAKQQRRWNNEAYERERRWEEYRKQEHQNET